MTTTENMSRMTMMISYFLKKFFMGNKKSVYFSDHIILTLLYFQQLGCNMSINVHFLDPWPWLNSWKSWIFKWESFKESLIIKEEENAYIKIFSPWRSTTRAIGVNVWWLAWWIIKKSIKTPTHSRKSHKRTFCSN